MAGDSNEGVSINKIDYLSTQNSRACLVKPCIGNVPTNAPANPPVKAPVKSPVNAPTPVCPYHHEWINGCCKYVCRNNYICPANSCRILLRQCYDSFDDCVCNLGYKKSTTEDKCVRA
jgi:hypothetical protein